MRKSIVKIAALGLLAASAGCADMSPKEKRVLTGTAIGAGGGALLGGAMGHPGVGAVLGGAAGAAGGYIYDNEKDRR